MTDDKLSTNESIDAALHLDGDPQTVKQFYADWAQNYDRDTSESVYTGPAIATQLLSQHLPERDAPILDAGCGTGLVGVALKARGYGLIDGFDLSPEMADLAALTAAYRHVVGNNLDDRVAAAPAVFIRVRIIDPHGGFAGFALGTRGPMALGHAE